MTVALRALSWSIRVIFEFPVGIRKLSGSMPLSIMNSCRKCTMSAQTATCKTDNRWR